MEEFKLVRAQLEEGFLPDRLAQQVAHEIANTGTHEEALLCTC
jgi:hypothetical protein